MYILLELLQCCLRECVLILIDDTSDISQKDSLLSDSAELGLIISMGVVILVLLVAIIVIVYVVRRIRGQVSKSFDDGGTALPRVSIRGMSELGHDGSINPAYARSIEGANNDSMETSA